MKPLEEIKKIKNLDVEYGEDGFGGYRTDPVDRRVYSVIFSWGGGWEHLSISPITKKQMPSWDLMCRMKDMFWEENETCVEYHPAKENYVNNMPYCLHIRKPINQELPIPPSIFVGIKEKGSFYEKNK